ncbi:MAG: glutamate synthase subunit beta [Phoenicibacter congonensis]|uniref:Glutamate synthase subunit beta n=1 Tax=Phoenicibacter congonensis TaxID=1944646 RepID=A0AA43UAZ4_9ACTN|nr:glutamate synthase subunit beta [Phoenicibacter congonensis]
MGKPGAYLHIDREGHNVVVAGEAVRTYDEVVVPLDLETQRAQASRCMDCGTPFCLCGCTFCGSRSATGCPLHNAIPEMNDLLFEGRLAEAADRLSLTNPFPEFTSRVCPAPCEQACNLGLHDEAVTIHDNERAISDAAWAAGVKPLAPAASDAKKVAVVGSGPAGLAAAWDLAAAGFKVTVYEKADRPGGLLMYGIPNMKLDKKIIERRINLMKESGIEFELNSDASAKADEILKNFDAVVLACGFRTPRVVDIAGKDLDGVLFAVDYLTESTSALLEGREPGVDASGKDVVVIGGGDTGVDCVATALRQGAKSVKQVIRASAPQSEATDVDWEKWPNKRGAVEPGYGQREAIELNGSDPRIFSTDTLEFTTEDGSHVAGVKTLHKGDDECCAEILPADLVLIAKGFVGTESDLLQAFHVKANEENGRVATSGDYANLAEVESGDSKIFVAGDAHVGSSLVATAMHDALEASKQIKAFLA